MCIRDRYYEIAKQADPDGTEESWQQTAQDNVDNYFKDNDVSRESLIEDWTASKQATKLYERVTENITVTEEEVQDEYDTRVAEMKETYAESPNSFEQDMMNGATIYYRPAGFREICLLYTSSVYSMRFLLFWCLVRVCFSVIVKKRRCV